MEGEPVYKLIHAVDPTTVKVTIKDRFAKLTLSSNKKKEQQAHDDDVGVAIKLEKRQSASRNLMEQLNSTENRSARNICAGESNEIRGGTDDYVNPLLRSDSSTKGSDTSTQIDEADISALIKQEVENVYGIDPSVVMEALHVTDDFSQQQADMEEQVDALSHRISSLAVSSKDIPISTTKETNVQEVSHVVPKECQRLSSSPLPTEMRPVSKTVISISISTSSEEYETDDAITISDSSVSDGEDKRTDYELVTSNIPQSGETADALLPCTFSNDKADRLEAFLRDVSQECREMGARGMMVNVDKSCSAIWNPLEGIDTQILNTQIRNTQMPQIRSFRAQQLAAADTESMSSHVAVSTKKESTACDKRLLTSDETTSMRPSDSYLFAMESQLEPALMLFTQKDCSASKRLAQDETEGNTLLSNDDLNENSVLEISNDSSTHNPATTSAILVDSVIISETSSEDQGLNATPAAEMSAPTSTDKEIIPSEKTNSSGDDVSPVQSQLSQIQMSMGSINISAKINIQIHISQTAGPREQEESFSTEHETDSNPNASSEEASPLPATEVEECCKQRQEKVITTPSGKPYMSPTATATTTSDEEEDTQFMTHAEKMLNELYGKSWQTPEIIRTLKLTSGSSQKRVPSKKQLTLPSQKTPGLQRTTKEKDETVGPDNHRIEESILDDFSLFRRDIVQTNLDSTRLVAAAQNQIINRRTEITNAKSEPRRTAKPQFTQKEKRVFKIPQTEVKKRLITTKRGRVVKEVWRQYAQDDSNSEGENASDDQDADKTELDSASDNSWCKNSSSTEETDEDSDYESNKTRKKTNATDKEFRRKPTSKDGLIYLDLSKDMVEVQEGAPINPPAKNDETFLTQLQSILLTCRREDKPKMEPTPKTAKPKRKLFTPNFGDEEESPIAGSPMVKPGNSHKDDGLIEDYNTGRLKEQMMPATFEIYNKHLEAIKTGKPIFKITPPRAKQVANIISPVTKTTPKVPGTSTPAAPDVFKTPKNTKNSGKSLTEGCMPICKYGFLKSLDVCVSKSLCHPDALRYRENYRLKKEELSKMLYDLYNEKLFDNKLQVPLMWNKKLSNTAGRCLNKKKLGIRSSVIELSEKVLTSADRLRCTLIHEICHAATWVFNGEGGHGATWKSWAGKANTVFPEIPKIGVCHQYDIEYKYTYKCTLCAAKSHAHSKSKKVENIRCSYCHGAIEILLNKKDKEGNIISAPVKEPTGFAKFVKENYKQHKRPDLKHADVMKILSNEFASLKVTSNAN